jgi:predicted DNA-binding antitoxin AbrB/MazE fold protein
MTIIATYKDGAFVPESPVSLPEGAQVQVIMPEEEAHSRALANLAALEARFPGSIGTFTHEEAEEMRQAIADTRERFRSVIGAFPREVLEKKEADIEDAFEKCDPDDWK